MAAVLEVRDSVVHDTLDAVHVLEGLTEFVNMLFLWIRMWFCSPVSMSWVIASRSLFVGLMRKCRLHSFFCLSLSFSLIVFRFRFLHFAFSIFLLVSSTRCHGFTFTSARVHVQACIDRPSLQPTDTVYHTRTCGPWLLLLLGTELPPSQTCPAK